MRTKRPLSRLFASVVATTLSVGVLGGSVGTGVSAAQPPQGSTPPGVQVPGAAPPVKHRGAPQPHAFPASEYGWYLSDLSSHPFGNYVSVIDAFPDLRKNHPEVMKSNLRQAIKINNEAAKDPGLVAAAQRDAKADKEGVLNIFSNAFGQELGAHFRQALKEHRLPKTQMLLGGASARAGGLASSTFVEKKVYSYNRPYVVAPKSIKKYNKPGEDYYSSSSKAFPSGHTNQATWTSTLLAYMLPEFAPRLLNRGAEGGYSRLVLGVHYPLDVIGGRMTGTAAAADRLNDPRMRKNLELASKEIRKELEWRCGDSLENCIAKQKSAGKAYKPRLANRYADNMHFGFKQVYKTNAPMRVPQAAPVLLKNKFPKLSYSQRASILRQTADPAGYPLDNQSAAGSWQRINLARAMSAKITVGANGAVTVKG